MVEQLKSGPFQAALAAMAIDLSQKDPTEKLRAWESNVGAFRIPTPSIIAVGNSVPPSIGQELDYLLHKLVNFDFKDRIQNLAWTRQKIWSMIRVLGHQKWQQKKIKEKRSKRALKEKKLLRKQERLRGSLVSKESRRLPC